MDSQQQVPQLRNLALDLIDTDERREQTKQLLDALLPHMAAEIENSLFAQEAKVYYEIFTSNHQPKIRVVLKLKKLEHEFLVLLDSKNAMFIVGSEMGGLHASNPANAISILKTMLMKFKAN